VSNTSTATFISAAEDDIQWDSSDEDVSGPKHVVYDLVVTFV